MITVAHDQLGEFLLSLFHHAGLDEFSAQCVADGLLETSLRGTDSHGVRLAPHYLRSAKTGRKNPNPNFLFQQAFPALAHLDADNAFGHAAGVKAIGRAMECADKCGIGAVAVSNSSHCGAMAFFALRAARRGYIAFAFTHADALLLSYGGTRPFFGTNPVCMAAPRAGEEPFCLDMATSVVPWNRVLLSRATGESLPFGSSADSDGAETTDAASAASLLPTGSYKGYGLAAMVEVLCGIMTGMAYGRNIPPMYTAPMDRPRHLGQFYLVLRPDGVVSPEDFCKSLKAMSDDVRAEPATTGERVMLAGDKEIETARHRAKHGIPLDDDTSAELRAFAQSFDVDSPF